MTEKEIIIFTDGGAIGNPGPGGWGAIVFNKTDKTVIEIGGSKENTTNNRMEMMAIIEALKVAPDGFVNIYSDSKYTITGITQWVFGWQKNNWQTKNKTDVLNKDLWQELLSVSQDKEIEWKHVDGHSGIPGNERVDVIANSFARGQKVGLYNGDYASYGINLLSIEKDLKNASSKASKAKAYSYISMVEGKIEKHATWTECEARVKGKKARFKKAISKEDEENIIKEWLNS